MRQGRSAKADQPRKSNKKLRERKPSGCRGCLNVLLTTLALVLVIALFAGIPAIVAAYGHFLGELPSPDSIASRTTFKTARILDREGRLLYEILDPNGGRRTIVLLADIAEPMRWATIAVEDGSFYVNPGFDLRGIARAIWLDLRGQARSGASTITQQLVKNTLLSNEVTFQRKLKEAVLAWEVSRRYSKDQILEMYLNEVYYGNMAYGVEAAAQTYFGKRARDLNLAESSLLAGLVQAPADHDPFSDLEAAKRRQTIALDLMAKYDFIRREEADSAKAEPLALRRQKDATAVPLRAPHFALYARDLVEKSLGRDLLYHGGLEITTTLDLDLQGIAEQAVRENLARIKPANVGDAALVAIDPKTGEVLAMVGSADFFDETISGQVNVALAKRQPGSMLKPFVYLAGFGKGYTPASILRDVPYTFAGGYSPQNHDGRFRGPVRIREALATSLNVPAVLVLQSSGIDAALAVLHRAGITDLVDPHRYGLALALGASEVKLLDLTYAYGTLASGGLQFGQPDPDADRQAEWRAYAPVAVRRVADGSGRTIFQYQPPPGKQVLDPRLSYLVSSILVDRATRGDAPGRLDGLPAAALQTAGTDGLRDGWAVGYLPDLVVGVWIGNADNTPMLGPDPGSDASGIWRQFTRLALDFLARNRGLAPRAFERPAGIQELAICADSGTLAVAGCPQMMELFADGSLPPRPSPTVTLSPTATPTRTPTRTVAPTRMPTGIASPTRPRTPTATPVAAATAPLAPTSTPTKTATRQPATRTPLPATPTRTGVRSVVTPRRN